MSKILKKYQKIEKNQNFYIDPGGPGGHPGGSRTDSGGEKHQNSEKNQFLIFCFFNFVFKYKNTKKPIKTYKNL